MPDHAVILAIETSQQSGGVALQTSGGETLVESLRQTTRHDDDLMPAIDRVMNRAGLSPRDLEAVGVSIGPGGFTGLRIAVTTAKMLAEALDVKLLAVPTALIVAQAYEGPGRTMLVALASKRETFWATRIERDERGEPHIVRRTAPDELREAGDGGAAWEETSASLDGIDVVLADEHLPAWMHTLCRSIGVPIVAPVFDPAACLICANRMLRSGRTIDPLNLLPLYARPPEAVALWEARRSSAPPGSSVQ